MKEHKPLKTWGELLGLLLGLLVMAGSLVIAGG